MPTPRALSRRSAAVVVAATLVVGAVTACGNASSPTAVISSGADASGTVTFWDRNTTAPASKVIVDAFNKSQSKITVKLLPINDTQYITKLSTAIRAGDVPDVVSLDDVESQNFIAKDQFLDITSQVNSLDFKDQLSPGPMKLAMKDGKFYGTPYVSDLSALYYNKDLFAQAGVQAPPTNYDELLDAVRKINALGNGVNGFSFGGKCPGCLTFTMLPNVYAAGSNLIQGDDVTNQKADVGSNDALRRTLELYRTLWADKLVPAADQTQDGTTWCKDFQAGKIGIIPCGYSAYATAPAAMKAKIGVAPLIGPDGGTSTYVGGANFGIPKAAGNASAAWEFIKFALGKDQQAGVAAVGFEPVRTDLIGDPELESKYPIVAQLLSYAPKGNAPYTTKHDLIFTQPSGAWFQMFSQAVYDGDIDGALQQGQSGFAAALAQP